jgi:hypothetical protein|tara:strand:+ start:523 stop:666 length:144 start_codon:yes stop_codon:yes gene_type:complete
MESYYGKHKCGTEMVKAKMVKAKNGLISGSAHLLSRISHLLSRISGI